MSSDNTIVKEQSTSKDKVSHYVNEGIASVFGHEMLFTCVKWQHTCTGSSRKFLTKYSRGEKEAGGRTGRSGKKIRKKKKHLQEKKAFAIFC